MRTIHAGLLGCFFLLIVAGGAIAEDARFSVQFENTPLTRVLDALKRFDPNLAFSLAPGIGERPVTASLVDVTVDEAMTIIISQSGLTSIKDEGVYEIRERPERSEQRATRAVPSFAAPVFNRPTAPTAAGAAPVAPTAAATAEGEEEEKPPLRLIQIKYADPAAISMLFGGPEPIWGDMTGGGGGGYGGTTGGRTGGYGGTTGGRTGGYGGQTGGFGGQTGGRGGFGGQNGGDGGFGGETGYYR